MVNRLRPLLEEPEEEKPAEDYWEIHGDCESFYVSRETAARVLRQLERRWTPRWIRFTDLYGATVRVRSARIQYVQECTQEQRAAERAFHRARRQEHKADRRPWEEDDDPW